MSETQKLNLFLDEVFDSYTERHPMQQAYLGLKTNYGAWDNFSDEADSIELELVKKNLKRLEEFDFSRLDPQGKISYLVYKYNAEIELEGEKFKYHNYPVNQLFGIHSEIPVFLMNVHRVDSLTDAYAYINRLERVDELLNQVIQKMEKREQFGIIPPAFVIPKVIQDCREILKGRPFDDSDQASAILKDFTDKLRPLNLPQSKKDELASTAYRVLKEDFFIGYNKLITYLTRLQEKAPDHAGAWSLPEGNEYYRYALKKITTTDLSPDEIFTTGIREVDRIQQEMKGIMQRTGYRGNLKAFFEYLKNNPRFYYSQEEAGKEKYFKEAGLVIDRMREKLDSLFSVKPKAPLVVKRVEPYREKSAAAAFYEAPAPDGSRPGIYYVNVSDMKSMPVFELEALAYHEAIPGHHMQIAIAQELQDLPKIRKYSGYTAYVEGWALYSELIPKELGFYEDPYSDFGRLSKELFRACRLVVDVGIHEKKWTREQAIKYLLENTPNSEVECAREVDRYFVWPGQATAYKVGMIKILQLREQAKIVLGKEFDLKKFHDVLLTNGALPLQLLEKVVAGYLEGEREK